LLDKIFLAFGRVALLAVRRSFREGTFGQSNCCSGLVRSPSRKPGGLLLGKIFLAFGRVALLAVRRSFREGTLKPAIVV
jgi:hypothetical protein